MEIDICGFSVLPPKSNYQPPADLLAFLEAGPPPIYIGFGSIVIDDPTKLTKILFDTIKRMGQRALVSAGWGNVGMVDNIEVPDNIRLVGSLPHDWLFRRVSCVVHHGGAGTTAAGLSMGCPTVIVFFFGDQQFWGRVVERAGAGPNPIPYKTLTVDKLTEALEMALMPSTKERVKVIMHNMEKESGARDGVRSFHRRLDYDKLRCVICPDRAASWRIEDTDIVLSDFASAVLVKNRRITPKSLVL